LTLQKTKNFPAHPSPPDLPRLRALHAEKPSNAMARLRNAWSDIEAALRNGHSLKRICQCLNEDGFAIAYKTLSTYLTVLRRESSQGRVGPQKVARSTQAPASPHSRRDPLANLLEHSTGKGRGFHFTGEPPDPQKLF
jgi:hypothetical protein